MTEIAAESVFGNKCRHCGGALNHNGPSEIDNLVKLTGLSRELVYGALGWLGRENKIVLEKRERAFIVSLVP
jgi:hypothetical protein